MVSPILLVCGGFLLAVLWMDLMFDVQVRGHGQPRQQLPEEVLASIAAYYGRVTTLARPMGHLVGGMMLIGMVTLVLEIVRGGEWQWLRVLSLLLFGMPVAFALLRVYPHAVRLGSRTDSTSEQSRLACGIYRGHLLCLGAVLLFVLLQLFLAPG